jgi:thiol-disulfide isomerase/thioredoxin
MRARIVPVVLTVWLLVALAACTEAPTVTRLPGVSSSTPAAQPTVETTADLRALKKRAGLPDCPESDPTISPLGGGLPDVVVPCLGGGREVRLAGLRGKPMMINFWAQWCGPCREEAPYLAEVAQHNQSDLMIMGVNFHDPYPDLAIEFAQQAGWRYPQLQDADAGFSALQVTAPPVTVFVRADGSIAGWHRSRFTSTEHVKSLVKQNLGITL